MKLYLYIAAIVTGLVVLAYCAFWLWFAGEIDAASNEAIARLQQDGNRAACGNSDVSGFPFAFALNCDNLLFQDRESDVLISAGALHAAARVYRPALVRLELQSPLQIESARLPSIEISWDRLDAHMRVQQTFPRSFEIAVNDPRLSSPALGRLGLDSVPARHFLGSMVRRGDDIDFSAELDRAVLSAPDAQYTLSVTASIAVSGGIWRILENDGDPRGLAVDIADLTIELNDGGRLAISGPLAVDEAGLVDGEITIDLDQAEKISALVKSFFPNESGPVDVALGVIVPPDRKSGSLTLSIDDGRISAGLFPLGRIPPL